MTTKALTGLLRLSSNYHAPVYRSVQRSVNLEVADVSAAIEKHLGERSAGSFGDFLSGYYRRSMPVTLKSKTWPILHAFMVDVRKQASAFMNLADPENNAELQRFMSGYLNGFTQRYCKSSEGQLLSLVDKFKESPDEMLSKLRERLGEWKEKRAEKSASDEIIRSQNAMAMETWIKQGVTKFRWVTDPKGHHCPFCNAMNGRIVKSTQNFFDSGETLYVKKAEGGVVAASVSATGKKNVEWLFGKENKGGKGWFGLKMYGAKAHPPIHKGCICRIVPAK